MSDPDTYPFRDRERPLDARVGDLLGRLTVAEKIGLLHQYQAPVDRLGVGPFVTGTEALHGLAWLGPATVFPQALGLASTWNPELVTAVGAAVGDEVRGFHHKDPGRGGLNVWAPVVNPLRDPRWGRNEEGYAEDPLLTATMAVAYGNGLRGDDPRYLRTAPTLKHFLGYNSETRRSETSSNLPPRVLHEYELPAFRAPLEQGAAVAVMAAYNLVNGRPAHLSPLIGTELRRWSAGELLMVSDAQAPSNVVDPQAYYPDHVTSHAALLKAGVDSFTDNGADAGPTIERVTEALRRGLIDESDLDAAVRHLLTIRMRLGEFDPPERNPYAAVTEEVINCPAHQALARDAARQGIVLLKNDEGVLPLADRTTGRVAVLGPLGDNLYEDWYSGTLPYLVTARQGIAARLGAGASVGFVEGIDRLVLRPAGAVHRDCLVASDRPEGAAVTAGTADDPVATHFDLFEWGHGVCALRAVANRRFVTVDDAGMLVNSAEQPNGWVVRETFTFEPSGVGDPGGPGAPGGAGGSGEDVVIRHIATGAYLTVDASGRCHADAPTAAAATPFVVDLVASGLDDAVAAAREADVTVVVLGNHPLINGRETEDRPDLALPPAQEELLRAVRAVNPRTVLVLTSSYPYAIGWAHTHVPAVLWSAHGGQEFGHALADVLFGDVDPAGRLTQTWYGSDAELPDLLDYDIIANDATYLYFRGTPLYPFGHGLTYATFEYTDLRLSAERIPADGTVMVSVDVHNRSAWDADEVVQLYTRQRRSRVKQPLRQLRGYRRVRVPAGGSRRVGFALRAADLAYWDVVGGRYVVEAAPHDVLVGRSSADIRLTGRVEVDGEPVASWRADRTFPAVDADAYADVRLVDATRTVGDAVLATVAGAWIGFEDVTFDPDVTSCTAQLSTVDGGTATVVLRRGDPLDGPVVATLTADTPADRYSWTPAAGPLSAGPDRGDLYAVFPAAGVCLRDLTFVR